MTIIAYRDGVLAADREVNDGRDLAVGKHAKIFRFNGCLYGCTGETGTTEVFKRWLNEHAERPPFTKDWEAIKIEPNSAVYHAGGDFEFVQLEAAYHAIGNGAFTALGAFFMGATPEQAVAAASLHMYGCGGGVDVLKLTVEDIRHDNSAV